MIKATNVLLVLGSVMETMTVALMKTRDHFAVNKFVLDLLVILIIITCSVIILFVKIVAEMEFVNFTIYVLIHVNRNIQNHDKHCGDTCQCSLCWPILM